ncbi:Protein tyrosine/serine phosphatase [Levilactobacillus zymae]|uniref:Protein tyrosine/serine phosphatase n=2 Tax=Levilactobacillus zymae TaxID=267363 RepID=A0A1Y6K078_9LACO|nr:Protein tyrosine/serine phosphatase [Levilactobacillus zymae]
MSMRTISQRIGVVIGLSVLLFSWLSGCAAQAGTTKPIKSVVGTHITLQGPTNVQDLGGIRTKDGQTVRAHRLIRSSKLADYTTQDLRTLRVTYHLRSIVDFRSSREIQQTPDPRVAHATYHQDSVVANNYGQRTTKQFYQGLVSDPIALRGYRAFFNQLLRQKSGATLFHCTYGKDRTGIGAMLVLSALGVSRQTILREYLYANTNLARDPHIVFLNQRTPGKRAKTHLQRINAVTKGDLTAATQRIDQKYGSMTNFLKKLGLTPAKQTQLKRLYLTK